MADEGRVITAKLPDDIVARLDDVAERMDRTKSWIVREALADWLSEEQRRYELTLEALRSVEEGQTIAHEEVKTRAARLKREMRTQSAA